MGILHLGSYIKAQFPHAEIQYLDLHLTLGLRQREWIFQLSHLELIKRAFDDVSENFQPNIVGFSCNMNTFASAFHSSVSIARSSLPNSLSVAGGHYPSSYLEKVAEDANIDYVVVGEGELPFSTLVDEFQKGGACPDSKIIDTKKYLSPKEISSFPPLDYEGVGIEHYVQADVGLDGARSITLLSSRGCPRKCIYCATHNVWDYKFRAQTPARMVEEVSELKEKYDIHNFCYIDDNFAIDKKRVKQFCRTLIEREINIRWFPSSVEINSLDEEMIELMAKSGCTSLMLALESAVPRIQKLIKKDVRLDHAKKIAALISDSGIKCECLLIFGFPGETLEEMQQTIDYARNLKCDWFAMAIATPLYGTEMYEICDTNNYLHEEANPAFREGNISTEDFSKE